MAAGREPGTCAVGYAVDDIAAITANVITQTGFVPIRLGTLAQSGPSIPAECYSPACSEPALHKACKRPSTRTIHPLIQAPIGNTGVITAWPKLLEVECRPEPVVDPTHHGR